MISLSKAMIHYPTIRFDQTTQESGFSLVKQSPTMLALTINHQEVCLLVLRTDDVVDLVCSEGKWLLPIGCVEPVHRYLMTFQSLESFINIAQNANYLNNP